MPLVLIHQMRTTKGAPPAPVGVWEIDGETGTSYYPPDHKKHFVRAGKALDERPVASLEAWAHFLAKKSRNWRLREPAPDFDLQATDSTLAEMYQAERGRYEALVSASETGGPQRRTAVLSSASAPAGASWGAARVVLSESWWIAAELVRRNPRLLAYEMHPGGGQYDVLCIAEPDALSAEQPDISLPRVMLNRVGTLQIHSGTRIEVVSSWTDALEAPTPHSIVHDLEQRAGWQPPSPNPATTDKALVYRFFATALSMTLHSRHKWDVRNEYVDSSEHEPTRAGWLSAFPAAQHAAQAKPTLGIPGEPASHFWALLRGEEAIAIVSIEGRAYFSDGRVTALMPAYVKHDRRIIPMTAHLLRDWL